MSDFIERHAALIADTSISDADKWLETNPEIIKLLQPRGLNGAKYFMWKGAKVCEKGKLQEILEDESKTVHDRMHPGTIVKVVSG